MSHENPLWDEADLERRLCHALDLAYSAVEELGEDGYSPSDDEEDRIRPEKIVAESALLLLAAYVAAGGVDGAAARGGIRRRIHRLAELLSPLARSERYLLALCVQPAMALDFAAPHIYLTRAGYPDLRFDRVLHEALWHAQRPRKERTPHRLLEEEWLLWMGSIPENEHGRRDALRQSALQQTIDLIHGSRDDVYAFTHALLYGRDLNCLPLPLPRSRDEILGEAEAALARCLDEEDYDLAGEVLLAWPYTAQPRATESRPSSEAEGRTWSPAAAFGFEVLTHVEDRAGFLPSPGTRVDTIRSLDAQEGRRYFLATSYHTVYVMGLLCAAALRPGLAPPSSIPVLRQGRGAAQRMLPYLDAEARSKHWYQVFKILDLEQQDSLASLLFQIGLRRLAKERNYQALANLLAEGDSLGLASNPMASQAAQLLHRLTVLSQSLASRSNRARGAAA